MKKLLIFGNSVLARMLHFHFMRDTGYEIAGFSVNRRFNDRGRFLGLDVFDFEDIENTHPPSTHELFIAIGPSRMNGLREEIFHEAKDKGYSLTRYVSPHAICDSPVGENTFVGDFTIIQPFVEIGFNNLFWEQVFIGNDSVISNNSYFSPKSTVGTFAHIENNCMLGTASTIKTGVVVRERTLVGASCYISSDTEVDGVYGERNSPLLGCISQKIDISM